MLPSFNWHAARRTSLANPLGIGRYVARSSRRCYGAPNLPIDALTKIGRQRQSVGHGRHSCVAHCVSRELLSNCRRHKHFSPFTVSGSNLANITICLWRTFGIANLWGRLACSRHSLLIFSWCNGTEFRYSFRLWGSSLTWWRAVKFMCISSSIYGKANTLKTYLQIFSNIFSLSSDKNFMHFSIFQISLGYFS